MGKKSVKHLNVAIIGAGVVGTVLGRIFVENGNRVVCVVSRTAASARKAGRFLRCTRTSDVLSKVPDSVDLIFIATPHDAVEVVSRSLAELEAFDFRRIAVCHASGMLTAAALDAVQARGATVFSFHPLQTFPRTFPPRMIVPTARGIYYGVDGSPAAVRMARRVARALEGEILEVPPEMRELYHAACVVASNHLTALLSVLETMFGAVMGSGRDFYTVFKPIVAATLRNVEATSPAGALSGPVARGGTGTVGRHLDAVTGHTPGLLPVFAALSLETVRLARAKGSITAARAEELSALIREKLSTIRLSETTQ